MREQRNVLEVNSLKLRSRLDTVNYHMRTRAADLVRFAIR